MSEPLSEGLLFLTSMLEDGKISADVFLDDECIGTVHMNLDQWLRLQQIGGEECQVWATTPKGFEDCTGIQASDLYEPAT